MARNFEFNRPSPLRRFTLTGAALSLALASQAMGNKAVDSQAHEFRNAVVGGGGFVSGLVFHPKEKGLFYARTDVGGAYRWLPKQRRWLPLQEDAPYTIQGIDYTGILSLALDPRDPDRVYLAAGIYTASWWKKSDAMAHLMASTDRGATWTKHRLPFQLGGNENGRGCGERLMVDPQDSSRLYLGTTKDGLWRSDNYGKSWKPLKAFQPRHVTFVYVGKAGRLVAGVADPKGGLLQSFDAGKTWSRPEGFPEGLMGIRWAQAGSRLIVTASDSIGPNNASKGDVLAMELDAKPSVMTSLDLPDGEGGYSGVSVRADDPNTIAVSTLNRWQPGDEVFLSKDGGKTWKGVLRDRPRDPNGFPYVKEHKPHWLADLKINPFNPEEAWFVTGYGVFSSRGLGSGNTRWVFENAGLEETVPLELISPPWGAPLYSAMGDQGGFTHWDLDQSPKRGKGEPLYGTCHSVATSWTQPGLVVKVGHFGKRRGVFSDDAGKTWSYFKDQTPGDAGKGPGRVAASSDGAVILWCAEKADCMRSIDKGKSWSKVSGLPQNLDPVGDPNDPAFFYALDLPKGSFYASRDGAKSFQAAGKLPVNDDPNHQDIHPLPGKAGEVWVGLDQGLYRSTNSGHTFEKVPGFSFGGRVGSGAALSKGGPSAIYVAGTYNGVAGFFRSADGGQSWVRVNDDRHRFGWINDIAGDGQVPGRFYLATGGRGVIVGEPR